MEYDIFGEIIPEKSEENEEKLKPVGIFDHINNILTSKNTDLLNDISSYNPYVSNLAMSNYVDIVGYAEFLNKYPDIPAKMHYLALMSIIPAKKRFVKWGKLLDKPDGFIEVQQYYQYNTKRTMEVMRILTVSQIEIIKNLMRTGGKEGKKTKMSK